MFFSGLMLSLRSHVKITMWFLGIIFVQWLLWVSPGFPATYRCHDQSGTTVLTDNPAQLIDCSRLESTIIPYPNALRSLQPIRDAQISTATQIPQNLSSSATTPLLQETNQNSNRNAEVIIPLKKVGGSFVVQANLNKERTAQLIVDTGASMTVLSTDIALDLGILGTTDNELLTVNTAGGSVQVNMNYLSSLNIGNAQAKNVAVAIHDLPDIPDEIEGLLGMSFLKHFLITLDAENARLILRPMPSS